MSEQRQTVLVVDDDADILEIVRDVLGLFEVRTITASDGIEALAVMRASHDIGLVLLDLMMPRMSGVDVLAEMKRDPELAKLPVVVMSGNYQTEQAVLRMGADDYILKPLEMNVLMRAVSRAIPVEGWQPTADEHGVSP